MKVVLCLLALGGVVAQPPIDGNPTPPSDSGSKPDPAASSSSGSAGSWDEAPSATSAWPSGSGSFGDAGSSFSGSNVGSGSGWVDWGWDGNAGWDPSTELWHFRPSWNWDSPSPPEGTMYIENWGNPPTPEIPSRRSFNFAADKGVSIMGASAEGGRADCGWRDWCVHLTFHSSYGVLSDFDAFVLDRYDSAERIYGKGFWDAREVDDELPKVFGPMVLGGFSPEEKAVLGNISSWRVEDMARRFNETRTTTWTLYPNSDEMDVVLSFKQFYTLLPGYPDGNMTQYDLNSEVVSEWGRGDQVLLRVIAKREGSGATSVMMPRVLNFTGSQLFQVESYSSLEYPQDNDNLTTPASAITMDVVFNRRRYGSGLPWNPARPSDACDACNQQVMNHPMVARCLHGRVPEKIFEDIYEQAMNEQMDWDVGEWNMDMGAPSNLSFYVNDVVDACFGLRWLLNGKVDGGTWSSDSGDIDRRSSSSPAFGDVGYQWSDTSSGSNGDYNDGSRGPSDYREPVYRYDDSGSRWSSWGYRDAGSASKFAEAGSRGSTSGSSGDPSAGDWPSVRDLFAALSIARETDTGIQCFVESRCPVGNRNFAEAAGRMVVLEHDPAFVRVNFTDPSYKFYVWMEMEGLGPEGQFTTPELSSEHSPEEIADLVAGAVPNASDYNLAVDVRVFNNLDIINWANMFNDWIKDFYNSGGSASEAPAAWSSYSTSSSDSGSSFQYPPVGEDSMNGFHSNVGPNSASMGGSSPDAGQGSDGSDGSDLGWFADAYPVPEPQFTVEISLRNVSVVPNILDVYAVSDEMMGSAPANMSWDARGSELRFQLSPLNLSTFEFVPPPPYVNLTWDEDTPDYPDPHGNGSNWGGSDIYNICTDCADAYNACDNSISCSLGIRAFLQDALYSSSFEPSAISNETDYNNRLPWGVDFGPKLRQSASYFTAGGYDLFMNFMVCLSNYACDLDIPRQGYSYSKGEYTSAEPTLVQILPAQSVFIVPSGGENIVMKYRGKEFVFEWDRASSDLIKLQNFITGVMNEYTSDESLWTRNPSAGSWVKVQETYDYDMSDNTVIDVRFWDNFFIESEPPRFRPVSSDAYNEINSTHWKVMAVAYRNKDDESFSDGFYSVLAWRKLSTWLSDLGYDPDFITKLNVTDDIPICHKCMDSWTQCILDRSCHDAMRYTVLESFNTARSSSTMRSSLDVSTALESWQMSADPEVYAKVLKFLSCLSAESCPVGYAAPSDPAAPLVPVTTKLASHIEVIFPTGKTIMAILGSESFNFEPQISSANDLESWLRSMASKEVQVYVQASHQSLSISFEISYYPAVVNFPSFFSRDDQTPFTVEGGPTTFASFQLSSNLVQYGQLVSWSLLQYWFGAYYGSTWPYYGDIFSGPQVCHGCSECWEALTRCQNDMDCLISTREVLVPLLRNASLPLSTSKQDDGQVHVSLNVSPTLLSLANDAFQSHEGWLAFAHLLHSMDACQCEVGFGQGWLETKYLGPTMVHIDSESVQLNVRLYPSTQLQVWFNGNAYSYEMMSSMPTIAADSFMDWFTSVASSDPVYLDVEEVDRTVDDVSQSVLLTVRLHGLYDEASDSKPLVNPSWIPTFVVTSSDVSSEPPAEVIVRPWEVSLRSDERYPVFDRLLDLLEYGAVSDEMPSSGSSYNSSDGSYMGGSYTGGDECTRCETLRQACFDDTECQSALSTNLLPRLQDMNSFSRPDGSYYADMSGHILDGVFSGMESLGARQKLLALLTCSATKWTSTPIQEGTSCIQKLADVEQLGISANLEIMQATSIFPMNKGTTTTVASPSGESFTYQDFGSELELAAFMENQVLGGYDSSGVTVKVTTDENAGTYTVIYYGLTSLSPPFITGQTSSSMQFVFTASTSDLRSAFSPWAKWLAPNAA